MMNIHKLTLGLYQTNTYVLQNGNCCVIIDPGYEPDTILAFTKERGLTVEAILLTHGHFDHVGGVKLLAADLNCPVYIHQADLSLPPQFTSGTLYYTNLYKGGDKLFLAGLEIQVLHTPGHTPGCVCLLTQNTMFSGDTLFAGSCGRTDLPGGSWADLRQSLQKLAALSGDFQVFPGHGESTTLNTEKAYNPYLQ